MSVRIDHSFYVELLDMLSYVGFLMLAFLCGLSNVGVLWMGRISHMGQSFKFALNFTDQILVFKFCIWSFRASYLNSFFFYFFYFPFFYFSL